MPSRADSRSLSRVLRLAVGCALLLVASCGPAPSPRPAFVWLVGGVEPRFDPTGPADPVRWALERLLGEGLVAEDSTGRISQAAAQRWDVRPDGLLYTFHLGPGLSFGDGRPCASADFRRALESGLNRVDHAAYAWLLSPVAGVDRVRAGRPLPPLGIAVSDDRTLVLRLARADPTLLHKLSIPGASSPWATRAGEDPWAGGLGPYRLVAHEPGRRMLLARRGDSDGPDTVRIEFGAGIARTRTLLRRGQVDLVWPLPARLLSEPLPGDSRIVARPARPTRRLWLVLRGDLPPTSKPAARRALAHGLNRPELLAALGPRGGDVVEWLPGAGTFDFPRRDAAAVREWLDRGRLGRSMHVVMAYSGDGGAPEVARSMQTEWARLALDVELRPLRGGALEAEALGHGGAQLLLLESQALLDDPVAELAALVLPRRGPPVGPFRTGWATREFDRWVGPQPPETPLDVVGAQQRLDQELFALPLAALPWIWVERTGGGRIAFHPHYGPCIPARDAALGSTHLSH